MRTRIAYLSADEVNRTLAMRMAQRCGVPLVCTSPFCVPTGDRLIARLYDLDHVPRQRRETILRDVLSGPAVDPMAVHSYALWEEQTASQARTA